MFVDTHCHLNMTVDKGPEEPLHYRHLQPIEKTIQLAYDAGVQKIINVGTSLIETKNSVMIAQHFSNVYATAGIHPCDCSSDWRNDLSQIRGLLSNKEENKIIGIGETGLDFYHKPFDKSRQIDAFKAHIELSIEYQLPLVVHVRESADQTLRVLEEYSKEARGVIHCFMQKKYVADTVIEWGWYLGIDGPITYPKNYYLRELVEQLLLEHLILETDTPFLPPQQYRGKKNSPAYIPFFAQTIADLHHISLQELGVVTSSNVKTLFGI